MPNTSLTARATVRPPDLTQTIRVHPLQLPSPINAVRSRTGTGAPRTHASPHTPAGAPLSGSIGNGRMVSTTSRSRSAQLCLPARIRSRRFSPSPLIANAPVSGADKEQTVVAKGVCGILNVGRCQRVPSSKRYTFISRVIAIPQTAVNPKDSSLRYLSSCSSL